MALSDGIVAGGANHIPDHEVLHDLLRQLNDGSTKANLVAAGPVGRIARVTDDVRGLWMHDGTAWRLLVGLTAAGTPQWDQDLTLADAKNVAVGTTTGTKIGTGTTQKLGFFNATPVAQQAANPDTSGATLAALETEVNELKALLRNIGFMAA